MTKIYQFLFAIVVSGSSMAQQNRVTTLVDFFPAKDNTIYANASTNSNGAGQYFIVGKTGSGTGVRRALIMFNLSSIPPNSTITNVLLTMEMDKTVGGAVPVRLHKLTADWGEGGSNAAGGAGAGPGFGASATTGDATWVRRFYNTQSWTAQGGDFSATISATTSVDQPASYTWSGAQMMADVQAWVNTPASNYGWLIKTDEAATSTAKRFLSKENAGNRPQLTVEYTSSTPVTLSFLKASEVSGGVLVNWETQSEFNNSFFLVEHSLDARTFSSIGKVNGAGTTNSPKSYKLTHQGVLPGKHYYRLAQTDINGQVQYSQVVQVNVRSKHTSLVISPNPVSDLLNVAGIAADPRISYSILSSTGEKVAAGKFTSTQINVSRLAAGNYILNIKDGAENFNGRFIVK